MDLDKKYEVSNVPFIERLDSPANELVDEETTRREEPGNLAWAKVNPVMAEYLANYVASYGCQKRIMFGSPVYFVNDTMWTGIKGNVVFIHLNSQKIMEIKACSGAIIPFEPRPDRVLKEYVAMPQPLLDNQSFFRSWLEQSYQMIKALPPKLKMP